jgi:uncharacterized protein (DUF1810 family)
LYVRVRIGRVADEFGLARFVEAQDADGTYARALSELRAGRKLTHWMWFVFPQIAGLGLSPTSVKYAISSLPEAEAYLRHPVLGPRLRDCARVLSELSGATARDVLGDIDALKLRSSMTVFERAAPEEPLFGRVIDQYFDGARDDATMQILACIGSA